MPPGPVLRTYMQYSMAFCSQLEAASNVTTSKEIAANLISKHLNAKRSGLQHSGAPLANSDWMFLPRLIRLADAWLVGWLVCLSALFDNDGH